ncbi:response regulator [Geomonas sp. RF6]|uniref:response regulator n=1 Tax=Geomonas sp. RF6 TaxID=2897342 RepID=UPI001E37F663|nr:response regulator [Geomonas sp. RF6]UFS72600.1 response regulator [Geomonas sp. RF6]
MKECEEREIWIMGLGSKTDRGAIICSYLAEGGYRARTAKPSEVSVCAPLAILLDVSPFSEESWDILLKIKTDPQTRELPILPVYLSEDGNIGGVFAAAGYFSLPLDSQYLVKRLRDMGLTDESEDYDLQAMIITPRGEEQLERTLERLTFEVVNAYTGKEAVALGTIIHPYMVFCSLLLADMSAFEIMEKFRLYPQTHNIPFFILLKDTLSDADRQALSRAVQPLVRKTSMTQKEFLAYFKKSPD